VASICGKCVRDWSFEFFLLDGNHLLAVALGPVDDATESFRVLCDPHFMNPLEDIPCQSARLHLSHRRGAVE
jgi:hypothetical protein